MEQNANLFMQRYVDKESIYLRASKSDKKQGKPLAVEEIQLDGVEDLKGFSDKILNSYTSKRVRNHMRKLMGQKSIITTNDIDINNEEEFILLMLGAINEEKSFYDIEYTGEYIRKGKYKIPNMIIKKKE